MLDQDAAQLIARQLRSLCNPDEITAAIEKYYEPDWPRVYRNAKTKKVYEPHHEAEAKAVFSDQPLNLLLKGGEGGGKALALDTLLPTPAGWTTMGEVGIGDRLFDECGTPCRVTAVSLVMYGHCCYEITFDDGLRITADAEHLWLTTNSLARKSLARRGEKYTTGSHAHLPHCQPKYDPEIRTTKEILGTLKDVRGFTNHSIPLAEPFNLPAADLPIAPYVLGAWLGDGTSRAAEITIGAQDKDEMIALIEAAGHKIVARAYSPMSFGIDTDRSTIRDRVTKQLRRNPDAFYARLCALNLIQNKHIPLLYLRGDYEQRLALLQGLMDTDGYISARGACEYCTASPRLANDFGELCFSLGIKVTCREGRVKCNNKWFVRYRFAFTPYIPVFRLSRKAKYIKSAGRHSVRRYRRYIVSVQECASVPVKCVVVDSPSHLFLAGRGMIPTHNSVAGIIKTLERLRRSMSGIMLSPDLPHFKRSLWPEFSLWCPWDQVVPEQRYRSKFSWEPRAPFSLAFRNGTTLMCGGIDDPGAWEGPNVNFAYFDEARRKKTPAALKTLTGRVRIPGPNGEPPQFFISTTPRKHWLCEYYGPLKCRCESCGKRFEHYADTQAGQNYLNLSPSILPICPHCSSQNYHTDDEHAEFKLKAMVVTLLTVENEPNLQEGFADDRALTLTSAEARVLLEAEWEDVEAGERFLPNMLLWDACREDLPPLGSREPLVVALDAATGRQHSASDCFGMLGVTRHPDPARRSDSVAVRYVHKWQATARKTIDFQGTETNPGPERVLRTLAKQYNIIMAPYDPDQLHDMATRLLRERIAWMFPFTQQSLRVKADTDLLYLVTHSKIAHDGNKDLRDHIDNADRKVDTMGKRLRIVKREESLKVDLAVCLSMSAFQCLRLNLG